MMDKNTTYLGRMMAQKSPRLEKDHTHLRILTVNYNWKPTEKMAKKACYDLGNLGNLWLPPFSSTVWLQKNGPHVWIGCHSKILRGAGISLGSDLAAVSNNFKRMISWIHFYIGANIEQLSSEPGIAIWAGSCNLSAGKYEKQHSHNQCIYK